MQAVHTLGQLVARPRAWVVNDDDMLMTLPVEYVAKALQGMAALAKNGLRYPFPRYGIQQEARAGMAASCEAPKTRV